MFKTTRYKKFRKQIKPEEFDPAEKDMFLYPSGQTIKDAMPFDPIFMITKAKEEEKAFADEKGNVGHCWSVDYENQTGVHKYVSPKDIREGHIDGTFVYNKKDIMLYRMILKLENINGALVWRYFTFYIRPTKAVADKIEFKETLRICFKSNECWCERPDKDIEPMNPGIIFNSKSLNLKRFANVNTLVTPKETKALIEVYPQFIAMQESYLRRTTISLKSFVIWFSKQRRRSFIEKGIPADILADLPSLDEDVRIVSDYISENEADFMPGFRMIPMYENPVVGYIIKDCHDFIKFIRYEQLSSYACYKEYVETCVSKFGITPVETTNVRIDVAYLKKGKLYAFEKNLFANDWSSNLRNTREGKAAFIEYQYNECLAVHEDGKISSCKNDPTMLTRAQDIIRKGFTHGRYIEFSDSKNNTGSYLDVENRYPLIQGMISENNLAAEQALKMGFYQLFAGCFKRGIQGRSFHVLKRYSKNNFSELFGPGNLGRRLLKIIPRDIDPWSFEFITKMFGINEVHRPEYACEIIEGFKGNEDMIIKMIVNECSGGANYLSQMHEIMQRFQENGKDYIKFFRALFRYVQKCRATYEKNMQHQCEGPQYEGPGPFIVNNIYSKPNLREWLRLYTDYLYMRPATQEYIDKHGLNEKLPTILKPSQIKWYHDHASEYQNRRNREIDLMETQELQALFQEVVQAPEYTSLAETEDDDTYEVILPSTAEDLFREGAELHHCVGGYWKKVASKTTQIIFVREKSEPEKPFFTGEVLDGHLIQLHGSHNINNHNEELRKYMTRWAKDRNIGIRCAV